MSNQPNPQKRNKKKSQEKQRWLGRRQYNNLRFSALSMLAIAASFLLILLFLLVFPRSKVSEIENRNLAKFPKFTLSGYFSGEFTSDVATWFDDTVPFRDSLKNLGKYFMKSGVCGYRGEMPFILRRSRLRTSVRKQAGRHWWEQPRMGTVLE